jgi:hypothetical protein
VVSAFPACELELLRTKSLWCCPCAIRDVIFTPWYTVGFLLYSVQYTSSHRSMWTGNEFICYTSDLEHSNQLEAESDQLSEWPNEFQRPQQVTMGIYWFDINPESFASARRQRKLLAHKVLVPWCWVSCTVTHTSNNITWMLPLHHDRTRIMQCTQNSCISCVCFWFYPGKRPIRASPDDASY